MKITKTCSIVILVILFAIFTLITPNSFAQDGSPELVVQVIYFHPKDREPQADIDTVLDGLIKHVQLFYADEMERHGFGRKTFRFEADENGQLIVHRVMGKFGNMHYYNAPNSVYEAQKEVSERFDYLENNIKLIWLDLFDPIIYNSQVGGQAGINLAAPLFRGGGANLIYKF